MIVATPVLVHDAALGADIPAWEIRQGRSVYYVRRINYVGYIPIGRNCGRPILGHEQLGSSLVTSIRVVQPPPVRSGRRIEVLPADYLKIPQDWYASESLVGDYEAELEAIQDEDETTEEMIPAEPILPNFDARNFPVLAT